VRNRPSPGVHPAVDERIVHGVAHRQPVDGQVQRLEPGVLGHVLVLVDHDEADVLRQQADGEDHHHHDHHLHHLSRTGSTLLTVIDCTLSLRQRGHVFIDVCLFVCLLVGLLKKNYSAKFHKRPLHCVKVG